MNEDKIKIQKYVMLIKYDVTDLFERLKFRRKEYLQVFAQKRTRDHFKEIFFSRYNQLSIQELSILGTETISTLHNFYKEVENLYWYIMHTEEMPNSVGDYFQRVIRNLEQEYQMAQLYLDADLGVAQDEINEQLVEGQNSNSSQLDTAEKVNIEWENDT